MKRTEKEALEFARSSARSGAPADAKNPLTGAGESFPVASQPFSGTGKSSTGARESFSGLKTAKSYKF